MINYSRHGYEIKRDFTNFSQKISIASGTLLSVDKLC